MIIYFKQHLCVHIHNCENKIELKHVNRRNNLMPDSHLEKKFIFICFNDSPPKMMKNAFCFILKALFVLKIFKFLS